MTHERLRKLATYGVHARPKATPAEKEYLRQLLSGDPFFLSYAVQKIFSKPVGLYICEVTAEDIKL